MFMFFLHVIRHFTRILSLYMLLQLEADSGDVGAHVGTYNDVLFTHRPAYTLQVPADLTAVGDRRSWLASSQSRVADILGRCRRCASGAGQPDEVFVFMDLLRTAAISAAATFAAGLSRALIKFLQQPVRCRRPWSQRRGHLGPRSVVNGQFSSFKRRQQSVITTKRRPLDTDARAPSASPQIAHGVGAARSPPRCSRSLESADSHCRITTFRRQCVNQRFSTSSCRCRRCISSLWVDIFNGV